MQSTFLQKCFLTLLGAFGLLSGAAIAAPATAPTTQLSERAVLDYLDQSIGFYRRAQVLEPTPGDSQQLLLRTTLSRNVRQTVHFAFQFARAEAAMMEATAPAARDSAGRPGRGRNLSQAASAAAERSAMLQTQLEELQHEIDSANTERLTLLYARRDDLRSQLDLANVQWEVTQRYAGFVATSENGDNASLLQQIVELERSVPEIPPGDAPRSTLSPATQPIQPPNTARPDSGGLFSLIGQLFSLTGQMNQVNRLISDATKLRQTNETIRAPIRAAILEALRRDGATSQPSEDDLSALQKHREDLDALSRRFSRVSAAGIPLAEQGALLDSARQSLLDWKETLSQRYSDVIRALVLRLGMVLAVMAVIVVLSEIWKRATYRYIHDARRQRQLMLLRRVAVGGVVLVIIIASVVTEFGSLATFAGLITAGVAVSLQTVILSGVAYFFFIGRFGVRVGDRVTIGGITGDVLEIGLFRIYLLELGGPKTDTHPTGRVVVFSNSVLFQPSAFYKQLPGSDYIWHEVSLTVSPESDFTLAEQRLLDAVNEVYADYKAAVESQHANIERSLHVSMLSPKPIGRLRFVDAGLEFVVRYPVELSIAGQIDDRITRSLLRAINTEPKLKLVSSGTPKIQPA